MKKDDIILLILKGFEDSFWNIPQYDNKEKSGYISDADFDYFKKIDTMHNRVWNKAFRIRHKDE